MQRHFNQNSFNTRGQPAQDNMDTDTSKYDKEFGDTDALLMCLSEVDFNHETRPLNQNVSQVLPNQRYYGNSSQNQFARNNSGNISGFAPQTIQSHFNSVQPQVATSAPSTTIVNAVPDSSSGLVPHSSGTSLQLYSGSQLSAYPNAGLTPTQMIHEVIHQDNRQSNTNLATNFNPHSASKMDTNPQPITSQVSTIEAVQDRLVTARREVTLLKLELKKAQKDAVEKENSMSLLRMKVTQADKEIFSLRMNANENCRQKTQQYQTEIGRLNKEVAILKAERDVQEQEMLDIGKDKEVLYQALHMERQKGRMSGTTETSSLSATSATLSGPSSFPTQQVTSPPESAVEPASIGSSAPSSLPITSMLQQSINNMQRILLLLMNSLSIAGNIADKLLASLQKSNISRPISAIGVGTTAHSSTTHQSSALPSHTVSVDTNSLSSIDLASLVMYASHIEQAYDRFESLADVASYQHATSFSFVLLPLLQEICCAVSPIVTIQVDNGSKITGSDSALLLQPIFHLLDVLRQVCVLDKSSMDSIIPGQLPKTQEAALMSPQQLDKSSSVEANIQKELPRIKLVFPDKEMFLVRRKNSESSSVDPSRWASYLLQLLQNILSHPSFSLTSSASSIPRVPSISSHSCSVEPSSSFSSTILRPQPPASFLNLSTSTGLSSPIAFPRDQLQVLALRVLCMIKMICDHNPKIAFRNFSVLLESVGFLHLVHVESSIECRIAALEIMPLLIQSDKGLRCLTTQLKNLSVLECIYQCFSSESDDEVLSKDHKTLKLHIAAIELLCFLLGRVGFTAISILTRIERTSSEVLFFPSITKLIQCHVTALNRNLEGIPAEHRQQFIRSALLFLSLTFPHINAIRQLHSARYPFLSLMSTIAISDNNLLKDVAERAEKLRNVALNSEVFELPDTNQG